jgi:3-phosphoshikimate 1-carboxyvinyltransferase
MRLVIDGVGLNAGRDAILHVLRRMGALVQITPRHEAGDEPMGDLYVEGGPLRGTKMGGPEIPSLIDELPTGRAGVLATGQNGH